MDGLNLCLTLCISLTIVFLQSFPQSWRINLLSRNTHEFICRVLNLLSISTLFLTLLLFFKPYLSNPLTLSCQSSQSSDFPPPPSEFLPPDGQHEKKSSPVWFFFGKVSCIHQQGDNSEGCCKICGRNQCIMSYLITISVVMLLKCFLQFFFLQQHKDHPKNLWTICTICKNNNLKAARKKLTDSATTTGLLRHVRDHHTALYLKVIRHGQKKSEHNLNGIVSALFEA